MRTAVQSIFWVEQKLSKNHKFFCICKELHVNGLYNCQIFSWTVMTEIILKVNPFLKFCVAEFRLLIQPSKPCLIFLYFEFEVFPYPVCCSSFSHLRRFTLLYWGELLIYKCKLAFVVFILNFFFCWKKKKRKFSLFSSYYF